MMNTRLIALLLFFALLLAACASGQPDLAVETLDFSFGDVVNGDVVTRDLTLRNEGNATLVIESISTSCGCTKATLDSMEIEPGASATLHVEFDAGAHGPDANGPLNRMIFIASNDPAEPEVRIEFNANVLPKS